MRTIAFVVLLFFAAPAARSDQAPISTGYVFGEQSIQLRGIIFIGSEGYVSVSSKQTQCEWLKIGQHFEEYIIKEIKADSIIVVTSNNEVRVIPLSAAKPGLSSSGEKLIPLEQLNWKWINSDSNPMRREAPDLPYEIASGWSKLTDSERTRIENYYRMHGWGISIDQKGPRLFVSRFHLREPGYYQKLDPDNLVEAEKKITVTERE